MTITASMVKELRERTGSGMMECKKALVETDGDIEAAIELMRKSGLAKAGKRAGKVAAEGTIEIAEAADGRRVAMVEVNSETDFVSKGDDFRAFAAAVARTALEQAPADLDALLGVPLDGGSDTVDAVRQALVAKIGENINVRRFVLLEAGEGALASYLHGTRIGVVVSHSGDEALGKDLAMHVAAHDPRPVCVSEDQVPAEVKRMVDLVDYFYGTLGLEYRLSHPKTGTTVFDCVRDKGRVYLVLEYIPNGSAIRC